MAEQAPARHRDLGVRCESTEYDDDSLFQIEEWPDGIYLETRYQAQNGQLETDRTWVPDHMLPSVVAAISHIHVRRCSRRRGTLRWICRAPTLSPCPGHEPWQANGTLFARDCSGVLRTVLE